MAREEDVYAIKVGSRFRDGDVSFRVLQDLGDDTWKVVMCVPGVSVAFNRTPIKHILLSGAKIRSLIEKELGDQGIRGMHTVGAFEGSRKGSRTHRVISFTTVRELLLSQRAVRPRI